MREETRKMMAALDAAPILSRELNRIIEEVPERIRTVGAGNPIPADIAEAYRTAKELGDAHRLIADLVLSIPDYSIRAILTARIFFGMPWELMCGADGTDSWNACADYLDRNAEEICARFRAQRLRSKDKEG